MDGRREATSAAHDRDLFTPRPGGAALSVGIALGARRPLLAALAVWAAAFVLLGAAVIGAGMLLTHVLLGAGLGGLDTDAVRWFVAAREPTLSTVTRFGSDLGSTGVILAVSAVTGVVLVVARLWRPFGFLLFALTLEFSLFLLTVMLVDRHRPRVAQLDAAPPTSSFPSGHTAASVTLYLGLAIVGSSLVRGRLARALVWAAAVALPLLVGLSRLYRGMHFPTDVAAGALLAGAALLIALFAVRCTVAASTERDRRAGEACRGAERPSAPSHQEVVS